MANELHWTERIADAVEKNVRETRGAGAPIVCQSGISPSGPIHLGNMREIISVHLVAEELRARGWPVTHVHSWDDFDRLRKVPSDAPDEMTQYIGTPLSDVPDPWGQYDSYASRFISEFEQAMDKLCIHPKYVRESTAYRSGVYNKQIKQAIEKRFEIFDILAQYQSEDRAEKAANERRAEYYPFRVYCQSCGKDTTRITAYDDGLITYSCDNCGHQASFNLDREVRGKLVWKVDWPMRWSFEGVDFEPGGEDHSSPGGSLSVGRQIVGRIFGGRAPYYVGYAFVGMAGRSKISSSEGTTATPLAGLEIFEPSVLRWLYVRRNISQSLTIDFGKGVQRTYDEWDAFVERINKNSGSRIDQLVFDRSVKTSSCAAARSRVTASFRLLSSSADITQGNRDQIMRIVNQHRDEPPLNESDIEPRLSCAIRWAEEYLPEDEHTRVADSFNSAAYAKLSPENKEGISLLIEKLDENWSLQALTHLIYGIPKTLLGLPMDAEPTQPLKEAQRSFFVALYSLICDRDTGPRLPTLFLAIGKDRVHLLLTPRTAGGQGI
jgi:lysyl-tRNA synthetase class 1